MERTHLKQRFPDTYAFFADLPEVHPFWRAVSSLPLQKVLDGQTLLPDLEQLFSSLHLMEGHHLLDDYLREMTTHDELMDFLTKLYVAYLYRNHGATVVSGSHGYDIEVEIADQLLALGVVRFESFDSLEVQFADYIEEELENMEKLKHKDAAKEITAPPILSKANKPVPTIRGTSHDFFGALKEHASKLGQHPTAKHHVLAAITHRAHMPHEYELVEHISANRGEIEEHFPDIAGVILIDPNPGSERAKFIPFHGDDSGVELLLNRY